MAAPAEDRRHPLRIALLAVIAVGLVLLGGGLAVAIGLGRTEDPSADSVDAGFSRDMARRTQAAATGTMSEMLVARGGTPLPAP